MSSQQLADALNNYYSEVGGAAMPITIDLPETYLRVHQELQSRVVRLNTCYVK
jgi:hypothetical protein